MDTLSKDLLGGLRRIKGAIEGVDAVKAKMRTRIKDYRSVLQVLQSSTPSVLQHELERLQGLLKEMEDLNDKVTADPDDGTLARIAKLGKTCVEHEAIAEASDAIDKEVVRQFAAIGAKCSMNPQAMDTILSRLRPPPLPDMAAVPAGALALPPSFVERSGVRAAVDGLLDQDKALAPFSVVGMGGAGKTVLASAVVREEGVRKHFRGGIFWVRVGRGAKRHLQPLLEGLSREMGAAPADSSHIVPHVFDGLEHVKQHLAAVASKGSSPRLVVLDDVWEREVVDALLAVGTKLLVTTRDHSVVGGPGCRFELGNMAEDEALELLLKTSMTAGQPGNDIRTQMSKVFDLCGGVPLVLAIAGSMPIVKGKGLTAGAWAELIETLTNVATKMETSGEELDSLGMVLETSFNALAGRKKGQLKRLAVLATGVVVPVAMLRNLWEIQDEEDTREEAEGLVGKCLLQDLGAARYRAHDLVLEFLKMKVKADANLAKKIAALQAQYLRRLDVLRRYLTWEHGAGNQSWFSLAALWRSAEELSGNPQLQVESYRASLKEAEARVATAAVEGSISSIRVSMKREARQASTSSADDLQQDVVLFGADATKALSSMAVDALERSYSSVGCLFMLEGKYAEAEPLTKRALAILENTVGAEHPRVAAALKSRAELLMRQRKDAEAGPLHERSQALQEKLLGPEHPNVAILLGIRAHVLQNQGKFAVAEPLLERSEEILEKTVGPGDPAMVTSLLARASSLDAQGKFAEAEHLYERSKTIQEKAFGPAHPAVAIPLNKLASMLVSQGEHARAEPLFERSLAIQEKYLGSDHPEVADSLNSMALLLFEQRKLTAAKPLFERSLAIREKVFGPEHRNVATSLNNLAGVLEVQEKYAEAAGLFERSYGILEKALDPEHPIVAATLNNWAHLLVLQGKYAEAEPRHKRALAIREKVLGPEDRSVARSLDDLAFLLARQGKYSESEAMYKRSVAILEKVFGPEHQRVVPSLMGCADVLDDQGKSVEAKHLRDRSLVILEKVVRRQYPDEYHRLSSHLTSDWSGGESRSQERDVEEARAATALRLYIIIQSAGNWDGVHLPLFTMQEVTPLSYVNGKPGTTVSTKQQDNEDMRWCVCKRWGPPSSLSVEEGPPLPDPGKGEVTIAVYACAVNFPDLLGVQGKYQAKPKFPFAPGGEVAGVVTALGGGCRRFKVGDRVVAFVGVGGFTTEIIAKERSVAPLPPGMNYVTASSFLVAYGTADYALRVRANLSSGELVLVLGASGGVGLAAVQLAKAAGATVIAAASTEEKLQACRDSGADLLLNYREPLSGGGNGGKRVGRGEAGGDWRRALKRLTGGRAIDVVLDNVGGADCETAVRSLAVGGRYLVVGFASGTIPSPPLNLVLLKEACVIGVFWGAWREREPAESAEQMTELVRLYGLGKLKPVVSRVYPLDQAPLALEDMGARKVIGKVVIETRPDVRPNDDGSGSSDRSDVGGGRFGSAGAISRL